MAEGASEMTRGMGVPGRAFNRTNSAALVSEIPSLTPLFAHQPVTYYRALVGHTQGAVTFHFSLVYCELGFVFPNKSPFGDNKSDDF